MAKNHFVLVELSNHDNYLLLLPIRDFVQAKGDTPTSRSADDDLVKNQQYKKVESGDNIIYIPPSFK